MPMPWKKFPMTLQIGQRAQPQLDFFNPLLMSDGILRHRTGPAVDGVERWRGCNTHDVAQFTAAISTRAASLSSSDSPDMKQRITT